ncbi:MAG: DNA repair protein RecO [Clostridiales bacterium]|nr:DNA repair protein RecO [Clostridiales bacterium]
MYTETEGIVLKQVKAANGRKMILLFSKKYGKISVGASTGEGGKSRSPLAVRPFTHGRYGVYKNRDTYNLSGAEVIKSYYGIGEDVEKFMCASYVLEFTEKILPEGAPSAEMFKLVLDFLDVVETRKKKHMTMVVAFQLKAIQLAGHAPQLHRCVRCGKEEGLSCFSVKEGGVVCEDCQNIIELRSKASLIYSLNVDTMEVFRYFFVNSLKNVEHVALNEKILEKLQMIIKEYVSYHLDIRELKSEDFLKE